MSEDQIARRFREEQEQYEKSKEKEHMEYYDIEYAREVGNRLTKMAQEENAPHGCEYPGCYDLATIHCGMFGCTHFVCETHGNGVYEDTPDHSVEICWSCAGKGWGE